MPKAMSPRPPLIKTKIRTPRRPENLLRRERLVNAIHANIEGKLTLIAAGAGYGKTSLLIDFAHDAELPVCWYSLDRNDTQVVPNFVEYLVAAIRQRFPHFGEAVLEAVATHEGPVEAVEPFIRLLIDAIEEEIGQYFCIVLDDYHEVIDSEPVNALVDGLLRFLPEHCHLIIATRGIPRRLTLSRLAARQDVQGLGVEHLRFSADEIEQLLQRMGYDDLTRPQIETLTERSEGWITGVLLAAQSSWPGTARDILDISGSTGMVFEFMAAEVLARQPKELQHFLLTTSLFNEMSPPLCDALLDINESAQVLRQLSERNLFTFRLDTEGSWYEYHQLFREFLRTKFESDAPDEYRRLCLKQADILADHDDWGRAVDSYITAQAYDRAAEALEVIAADSFGAGQLQVLQEWIDALPEKQLQEHPRLLLFRGRIHVERGQAVEALAMLDRALAAYRRHDNDVGAARVLVQQAISQRMRNRLDEAIGACQAALDLAEGRDHLSAMQAHQNLGICYAIQGRLPQALEEMRQALEIAESDGDVTNAAFILHDMGNIQTQQGQLTIARRNYHHALNRWRRTGNPSSLAMTLQCLGIIHHYLGEYVEAENRFQESLSKAESAGNPRLQVYGLTNLGDLYRETGRYDRALALYDQALEMMPDAHIGNLILYVIVHAGEAYRLKGETERAHQLLIEALDQMPADSCSEEMGHCQRALGALALECGDLQAAHDHLYRALDIFEASASVRPLAQTHLHLARLTCVENNDRQIEEHLQTMQRLSRELGSDQFMIAEGTRMLPVLQRGQDLGVGEIEYARIRIQIEQVFATAKPTSPIQIVSSHYPFEFMALNGGQVLNQGEPVNEWASTTARTMLFLFLSHPQGLHRDRIIAMLWPENSAAKGLTQFHTTKYRIHQALDTKDFVIREGSIYRVNPEIEYTYDVDEFERLAALAANDEAAAPIARARAIELYRTDFLHTSDGEWCREIREALRLSMQAILYDEAIYQAERGAIAEAEALYTRLLSMDKLDERAHRGLMWCRAQDNDRAGIARQFRECEEILDAELDVEPDAETSELYETLMAGESPSPPS